MVTVKYILLLVVWEPICCVGVYLDISQISIKLLGHIAAEARCWCLFLFVTYDLVPENILFSSLKYSNWDIIVASLVLWVEI